MIRIPGNDIAHHWCYGKVHNWPPIQQEVNGGLGIFKAIVVRCNLRICTVSHPSNSLCEAKPKHGRQNQPSSRFWRAHGAPMVPSYYLKAQAQLSFVQNNNSQTWFKTVLVFMTYPNKNGLSQKQVSWNLQPKLNEACYKILQEATCGNFSASTSNAVVGE